MKPRLSLDDVRRFFGHTLESTQQQFDAANVDALWAKMKLHVESAISYTKERTDDLSNSFISFLQQIDLLKWTQELTDGAASVYDKAMDAEYLRTYIGGGEHRLFDGGHTIAGSWDAVENALKTDTKFEEICAWVTAYTKDFTTPGGMPFSNLNKADFDSWVDKINGSIPGLDRKYLYDLATFDAMEVVSSCFSVVAVFFLFNQNDKAKLAETLGAMGISSIAAANPILAIVTITAAAYAYQQHRTIDVAGLAKGGGLSLLSALIFSIAGFPVLVELAIVLTISILLRKYLFENAELGNWIKLKINDVLGACTDIPRIGRVIEITAEADTSPAALFTDSRVVKV